GSLCHMVRSVCRRVERNVISLSRNEYVNPVTVIYLNRLSDLLFIFARELVLKKGGKEVYWESKRLKQSA
ncbi:MAG: ATP:cob(I)alamin adenosyltransferase, partial [Thiotrichales bacterium]|nr:ATP:cob(I)alamin adenosyltransferase [Thiotrichales bacterium]